MALRKLSLVRGDSQTYTLTLKGTNGTAYCLKNWALTFTMKPTYNLPDSAASLQKVVTTFSDTTGGTTGVAVMPLLPADTASLTPGEYDYDFQVTTNLSEVFTILRGKLDLEFDVTRTAGTAGTAT